MAIHPKSPAWHCWLGNEACRAPLPARQRLTSFAWKQQGQWGEPSPGGYSYWPGAWKSLQRQQENSEWPQPKASSFPAYDANWTEQRHIVEIQTRLPLGRLGEGDVITEQEPAGLYSETCLICEKGFASRAAWAMRSSKLHGYRIAASILLGTLCQGYGKRFVKAAWLHRHLVHSRDCSARWGTFRLSDGVVVPSLHEQQQPLSLEGVLADVPIGPDSDEHHRGVLRALLALDGPSAETIWDVVIDLVEPTAVFRRTLRAWTQEADFQSECAEAVEDVLLVLGPEICCDSFCQPKGPVTISNCCAELPGRFSASLPFVVTGTTACFKLEEPPGSVASKMRAPPNNDSTPGLVAAKWRQHLPTTATPILADKFACFKVAPAMPGGGREDGTTRKIAEWQEREQAMAPWGPMPPICLDRNGFPSYDAEAGSSLRNFGGKRAQPAADAHDAGLWPVPEAERQLRKAEKAAKKEEQRRRKEEDEREKQKVWEDHPARVAQKPVSPVCWVLEFGCGASDLQRGPAAILLANSSLLPAQPSSSTMSSRFCARRRILPVAVLVAVGLLKASDVRCSVLMEEAVVPEAKPPTFKVGNEFWYQQYDTNAVAEGWRGAAMRHWVDRVGADQSNDALEAELRATRIGRRSVTEGRRLSMRRIREARQRELEARRMEPEPHVQQLASQQFDSNALGERFEAGHGKAHRAEVAEALEGELQAMKVGKMKSNEGRRLEMARKRSEDVA
ncbi:unnamed protein product [Symbiodinium microadriaticum]|nr:unnamed protein product [Symbiodinium microadriaticum]